MSYLKDINRITENFGMFLFNLSSQSLKGVWLPVGIPEKNIVPKAWGGKFPHQVRNNFYNLFFFYIPKIFISLIYMYKNRQSLRNNHQKFLSSFFIRSPFCVFTSHI